MLNDKKLYTYLTKFDIRSSSKGWLSLTCPYCGGGKSNERSGAIHIESEYFKCWRAKCGVSKSLTDFIIDNENIPYREVYRFIDSFQASYFTSSEISGYTNTSANIKLKKDIELPYGYVGLFDDDSVLAIKAQRYLTKRGFDVSFLESKGWGFSGLEHKEFKFNYYGYIIIPFVIRGRFVYYIGRDFLNRGSKYKYKNPERNSFGVGKADVLYNEDALVKFKIVYMTEGLFCAETIGEAGFSTQGWALSFNQINKIMKSPCSTLITAADKGFYVKAIKTMIPFLEVKKEIRVVSFEGMPDKYNDVNAIGKDAFMDMVESTPKLSLGLAMDIITQ